MRSAKWNLFWRSWWPVLLLMIPVLIFWSSIWVAPLKLMVVMCHELSHALMTWLTGGEVIRFDVALNQSGHVISRGGNRFLTLSAGYLGSFGFGLLFLYGAQRASRAQVFSAISALVLAMIVLLYVRSVQGIAITIAAVALFGWMAARPRLAVASMILRLIGLTSLLYAPLDIWQDTIAGGRGQSDAAMLADLYGGTEWLWGGVWLLLTGVLVVLLLRRWMRST